MRITIHRIRKLIHLILLRFYYFVIGIKNLLIWKTKYAKEDSKVLSDKLGSIKLKSLQPKDWHVDTIYLYAQSNNKRYFIKKTKNKTVSNNEKKILSFIKEHDLDLYNMCVNTIEIFEHKEYTYIIQDYYDLKTLESYKPKEEDAVRNAINQLFFLCDRLYILEICHNDIREGNFFCDNKGNIKLFDFGYACFWSDRDRFSANLTENERFNLNHHERPCKEYLDDSFSFLSVMKKIDSSIYSSYPDYWLILNQRTGTRKINL